ncbi:elongation factor [Trema orientale]|uniref:Elongation factor n=1 Tax=Trema orientale TaxID=63057 RepID=A0A2P5BHF3_TREOI|nr:elongation factor [Trema orientale]
MGGHEALEVAKTVMEVADVAWTAVECCHHYRHHHDHEASSGPTDHASSDDELDYLRSENLRLRNLLHQNLKLLQNLSDSPSLLNDCPPDLYARLIATVDSENFLARIKSLQLESGKGNGNQFPFKIATENDLQTAEVLINVDKEEPSWWVWVTEEMVPSNVEERSGIDNDSYVIVSEEHVVDGVANFMAKCIVSNPKAQKMTPEELQKSKLPPRVSNLSYLYFGIRKCAAMVKALGGVNKLGKMFEIWHAGKLFYSLATWGLALTGLYQTRAVLKVAAMGVHTTSKVVMRAL